MRQRPWTSCTLCSLFPGACSVHCRAHPVLPSHALHQCPVLLPFGFVEATRTSEGPISMAKARLVLLLKQKPRVCALREKPRAGEGSGLVTAVVPSTAGRRGVRVQVSRAEAGGSLQGQRHVSPSCRIQVVTWESGRSRKRTRHGTTNVTAGQRGSPRLWVP